MYARIIINPNCSNLNHERDANGNCRPFPGATHGPVRPKAIDGRCYKRTGYRKGGSACVGGQQFDLGDVIECEEETGR